MVAIAAAATGLAMARIASTYSVFNQVNDAPYHVARGVLWLTGRPYHHVSHPPLAPVTFGIGPLLDGVDVVDTASKLADGNAVLYGGHDYFRTLTLARMGNLIFFFWSVTALWLWSRSLFGVTTATLAVVIFTHFPLVLGHSGVVATDMAITATTLTFVIAMSVWIKHPSVMTSIGLGVAIGLTLLSKLSAVVFLPVCAVTVATMHLVGKDWGSCRWLQRVLFLALAMLVAADVLWTGYRYSFGPVGPTALKRFLSGSDSGTEPIVEWLDRLESVPVICPEYVRGIDAGFRKLQDGHAPYVLGRRGESSWLYFPLVLALKTPTGCLVGAIIGTWYLLFAGRKQSGRIWEQRIPLAIVAAILLVMLPSSVNLGVRHVLPVTPFLALIAAVGFEQLYRSGGRYFWRKGVAVALVGWLILASWAVHPNYLSYFNGLAGEHPDRISVATDIDWGQGLEQCGKVLRKHGAEHVHLAYYGTADPSRHGLPEFSRLGPHTRVTGWVACSLRMLRGYEGYEWLDAFEPIDESPPSIRVYYIPGEKPSG